MSSRGVAEKSEKAREVVDILEEISILLVKYACCFSGVLTNTFANQNTRLNRAQLSQCISLIENGINPVALAVSRHLVLGDELIMSCLQNAIKDVRGGSADLQKDFGRAE